MKLHAERSRVTFRLGDATVKGSGLQPEFDGVGWTVLRNAIYEGRRGVNRGR